MLTRLKARPEDEGHDDWLLFKERDLAMDAEVDILTARPESVKTGRRIEELVAPPKPVVAAEAQQAGAGKGGGAVKAAMPATMELQLASPSAEPPTSEGWLHEIKFDGYRTWLLSKRARRG